MILPKGPDLKYFTYIKVIVEMLKSCNVYRFQINLAKIYTSEQTFESPYKVL